jgi:hypothetical protein
MKETISLKKRKIQQFYLENYLYNLSKKNFHSKSLNNISFENDMLFNDFE